MVAYGDGTRFYMPAYQIVLLVCLAMLLVAAATQWFRDVACPVCGHRMIVCTTKCFWCRLYNAQMPEGKVLEQLQGRDEALRGRDPYQRDVCKRVTVSWCLRAWRVLGLAWLLRQVQPCLRSLAGFAAAAFCSPCTWCVRTFQEGGLDEVMIQIFVRWDIMMAAISRRLWAFCCCCCVDAPVAPQDASPSAKPPLQLPEGRSAFPRPAVETKEASSPE
eukprot:scaffold1867_cov247-Pinguiococcus_pyrenoidosus.AAC.2